MLQVIHTALVAARKQYNQNKLKNPFAWDNWAFGKEIELAERLLNRNKLLASQLLVATNLVNYCPNRDYYYVKLA